MQTNCYLSECPHASTSVGALGKAIKSSLSSIYKATIVHCGQQMEQSICEVRFHIAERVHNVKGNLQVHESLSVPWSIEATMKESRLNSQFFHCYSLCLVIVLTSFVYTDLAYAKLSIHLPIEGEIQDTSETFTGSATAYFSGGGILTLTTNRGVTCQGEYINTEKHQGNGTVVCEDGRLGYFNFVASGFTGNGEGLIDTKPFAFRIGK